MNPASGDRSQLDDCSDTSDDGKIVNDRAGDLTDVATIEKALSPSQRCDVFRLLGASVETMVVVKRSPPGLWVTISDLAKRLRISKQSASKRVERLESSGVLQTRSGARGTKLVNLGQFDQTAGELTDAARQLEGSSRTAAEGRTDVLCFVPETGAWACGGRSGHGFIEAIATLFSVDPARAGALVCEALGRRLINICAGAELQAAPVERESTPAKPAEQRA